jgi:outer membrane lipoprotein-sorting protein
MTANVQETEYTAVIDETTTENGKIRVMMPKPHDLKIRLDFDPPDVKQVMIDDAKAEVYYPKTNSTQTVVFNKQSKPMVEQLMHLGFGTTSQELQTGYTVRYIGAETAAGEAADRIELTPKDKDVLQQVRRIELWISGASGLAVQEKLYEPGKNYHLAVFTHIDLQTRVTEADWKLKIRQMRMRIETERTRPGQDHLAIKTGRGGLMDAEFVARTLCLENGWQEPNTLRALERGRDAGTLPQAAKLIENYRKLRRVEAILRRWSYEGESVLPLDTAPYRRVSVRCGFATAEEFRASIADSRNAIREAFAKVFGRGPRQG